MPRNLKILKTEELSKKICVVVGTRPGIVMFSPIIRELKARCLDYFIVHTGQHYSYNMDQQFFDELDIDEPHYKLEGMSELKFHGEQTAKMLVGCERIFLDEKPGMVLVGGDANTNLAGALAARKLRIPVGHVEAGERSYDWRMPEEHNRRMIDHISDILFVTNFKGVERLEKENIQGKVLVTGNPIVDSALQNRELSKKKSDILVRWGLKEKGYLLLTTHREENVDSRENLANILEAMKRVSAKLGMDVIFPAHPRTLKRIEEFDLKGVLDRAEGVKVKEAVGYLDFIKLLTGARLVFTDSGGVQQEACIFKVPCVTLRENTEWTETVEAGVNVIAGTGPEKVVESGEKMISFDGVFPEPFGRGDAAKNIIDAVVRELGSER